MSQHVFPSKPITDIFTPDDTSIDRRRCHRTVPMKVLVLGMGRTGTLCKFPRNRTFSFNGKYTYTSLDISYSDGIETLR
jgi:hypothetical protein